MMVRKIKTKFNRLAGSEAGQVFIIVLIMLLLGSLIISPLLSFTGTGLKTGQLYEDKTSELYAADSGIEDGIWQINYDELASLDSPTSYSVYDYNTVWDFQLGEQVNSKVVDGTIKNIWIPKDVTVPSESAAEAVIEGVGGEVPKVIVTGGVSGSGDYRIRLTYNIEEGDDDLGVYKIGIWIPPGFEYVTGSSNLEEDPFADYYCVPAVETYNGGQAIIWDFGSLLFWYLPGVQPSDVPMITEVTFDYTARRPDRIPNALSWINTDMNLGGGITYAWDADTKVYKITSEAGDTFLEAYSIKSEMRELGGAIAGDYYAFGNTLLTNTGTPTYRDRLYEESSASVTNDDIPESAFVDAAYLYWSGWIDWHGYEPSDGGETIVFSENCSDFNSPPMNWDNGCDWNISSGRFRGHSNGDGSCDFLTMDSSLDLSDYGAVTINWQQSEYGYLEYTDRLYFAFSSDGGGSWGGDIEAFRDDIGSSPQDYSYDIPAGYLTDDFRMRFYLYNFTSYDEYCYIDNINITVSNAIFSDNCSDYNQWNNGSDWSINYGAFHGHHSGGNRYLTLLNSLDLSSYSGSAVTVNWDQWENGYLESYDRLYFAFSSDGGSSWGSNVEAFHDDIGSSPQDFSYAIPAEYLTDNFMMRFYLESFDGYGEYCYIDNITIVEGGGSLEYPENPTTESLIALVSETARVDSVMFNDTQITADIWQVSPSIDLPGEHTYEGTWSYNCYYDATDLVEQWIEDESLDPNGVGSYTVGHVVAVNENDPGFSFDLYPSGETGYPLGTPAYLEGYYYPTRHNYCYSGWSLILIYSSPETKGHQLYLYDVQNPNFTFVEAWHNDPDFDGDGEPGGSISGFLAPDSIVGEDEAARLTVFAGEGDSGITGDYLKVNDVNMSNDASPSYNVWNSASPGLSIPGIDIDTFTVEYPTIEPEATHADINLPTDSDGFAIIYIIISFRSDTVAGGTISYLIRS